MKKSTSRLIFTLVAVFLLIVAATSMLGNIDSAVDDIVGGGSGGGGDGTTTTTKAPVTTIVCRHESHNMMGICQDCGKAVEHSFEFRFSSANNDGTHTSHLECEVCGYDSLEYEDCYIVNGKCLYCDAPCVHSAHSPDLIGAETGYLAHCLYCDEVVAHSMYGTYEQFEEDGVYKHRLVQTCFDCRVVVIDPEYANDECFNNEGGYCICGRYVGVTTE